MKRPNPSSQRYSKMACAQAGQPLGSYEHDLERYCDWLMELLIETRAQIGMNTCGGDLHSPAYWAFLEHLSKELGLDPLRLCEPGYPKWKPSFEESERAVDHFVAEGLRQFREKMP